MGMLSDAMAPRTLMTAGALLGAAATQLFGMTGRAGVFFMSRGLEGLGVAASGPALLAHLTDATDGSPALRARVIVEPTGAVGAAAVLTGKLAVPAGARIGVVLSGGNVDPDLLLQILQGT